MADSDENITAALSAWNHGDDSALERLMPLVVAEITVMRHRNTAKAWLRKEVRGEGNNVKC